MPPESPRSSPEPAHSPTYSPTQSHAAPWLVGLCYLPFGFNTGFVSIALPLLLTARGVTLDRVAQITFVALLPTFSSFLITPVIDSGIARKSWALLLALVAALSIAAAIFLLHAPGIATHQTGLMTVLVIGSLAAQMYGSAMGGLIPSLVEERLQGNVSGWINTAYLSGAAIAGMAAIFAVQQWPPSAAAALLATLLLTPALVLQALPSEDRIPRPASQVFQFGTLLREITALLTTRQSLIGFLIFIVPSSAFAAQNLFSGLGREYAANDTLVAWITGAGVAIACSAGALLGGWMCNRWDRRMLVVGPGILSAVATLGMAFGPRTWWVFLGGVLLYNVLAGINYAAVSAVAFEIMGINNPLAASQYAMMMASCNVAIEFALWADGRGYHRGGAVTMLCTDAALSLVCGPILILVLLHYTNRQRTQIPAAASV
jgi:PAT family beta-lactamase induction signal transducer AmpG